MNDPVVFYGERSWRDSSGRKKVKRDLDTEARVELFNASFEWDSITPGTMAEPDQLSLTNLFCIVEAHEEPLSQILRLEKALWIQFMTGLRRFSHRSVLVVPGSQARTLLDLDRKIPSCSAGQRNSAQEFPLPEYILLSESNSFAISM